MVMQSTSLDVVQALFQATIQGITPSITNRQADAWTLRGENRRATTGLRTRSFHIAWENDQVAASTEFAGWTTGSQVNEVSCVVHTDYSIPLQDAYPIIASDHRDLLQNLSLLKRTGTNGIWWVESEGFTDPPDEQGDHYTVEHAFLIRYMQNRIF
jgi:hypothetical protein